MATVIHLDTHVLVWLYAGDVGRFPEATRRRLEAGSLVMSPMVELELQYLFEIGRVAAPAREVVGDLSSRIGLAVSDATFAAVAERAVALAWTRDPFDRMIVATAQAERAPLLTRDDVIRRHYHEAVWDT